MEFIAEKSERLDKFLVVSHAKFSRSQWQRFIRDGVVKINNKSVLKPSFKLKKGDKILILEEKILLPGKEFIIEPEPDIPLEILYEDKNVVVINKQSGLVVHPTSGQHRHTLVNALVARYPEIIGVGESPLRPGIVHRLDKDTSGIMVIAKNQKAFYFLKNQFLSRTISKTYLALVRGVLKEKEGTISFQIRPAKRNRLKRVAIRKLDISGKKSVRTAETFYKVKEALGGKFSLLEVSPKTGRTHQIRVHLSAIGHPVVGDRMYGGKEDIAERQMLHADKLEFISPSGKKLKIKAGMPEDMKRAIAGIKK
ncbi:MAG: RluA family pseudouridine synthase [Candidatus Harrisonbacteria bacterium]|nr:RluA family pseudouridine synthase [Candidatus Harrisonbacteria bacterium]